jgi:hypothetical protein
VTSVVPRFRRFNADTHSIDASLRRIPNEARVYASTPSCSRAYHQREMREERAAMGSFGIRPSGSNLDDHPGVPTDTGDHHVGRAETGEIADGADGAGGRMGTLS